MAFNPFSRGVVWRSGLGLLRQFDVLPSERDLTLRLMSSNPIQGQAYQSYQAVARQLLLASRAAYAMGQLGDYRPQFRDIPTDPSIGDRDARLNYTVAVTVRGADGASVRTVVNVRSETPLTADEVRQRVGDQLDDGYTGRRSTARAIARLRNRDYVDITILAVGQRP